MKVECSEGYVLLELVEMILDVFVWLLYELCEIIEGGWYDKLFVVFDMMVKVVWELLNWIGECYFSYVCEVGRMLW